MNASAATILDMARQGHVAAMGEAEDWMPKLEVNELISLVVSVWEEKSIGKRRQPGRQSSWPQSTKNRWRFI